MATRATKQADFRYQEAVAAFAKYRERQVQKEVDKQNKSWYRRLFKKYVTSETVELPGFFELDTSVCPPGFEVEYQRRAMQTLSIILEASKEGGESDQLLLEDSEYNLLRRYARDYDVRMEEDRANLSDPNP
jgi:hypothetical protein